MEKRWVAEGVGEEVAGEGCWRIGGWWRVLGEMVFEREGSLRKKK